MSAQSTDLIQYAISPEGSYGTYAAPVSGEYLPRSDAGFNESMEQVDLNASKGDVSPFQQSRVSKVMGAGAISVPVGSITSGIILGAIAGADDATPSGSDPYTHTPVPVNSNGGLSYSIVRIDSQGGQKFFTGARPVSIGLSWEMNGEPLFWNTEWLSKGKTSQSNVTPAYADEVFFYPEHVTIDIVNSGVSFGTTDYPYEAFELNFNFNSEARGSAGQTSINQVYRNLPFEITGSITTLKDGDTEFQEAFTNTYKAIRINMVNGTNTIVIDLNELSWGAPTLDTGLSTMETIQRPFKVHNAINNYTASITNGQAAYPLT
jgi:hypothetical protein